MTHAIYYFTGTGNSLELATRLADELGASLRPMVSYEKETKVEADDCVGLVYPTYMFRPPLLVKRFISKLSRPDYLYAVAVNGGDPGDVLERTGRQLADSGLELNAGFKVSLPDNYTPFGGPPSDDKQREMFAAAEQRVIDIVRIVEAKENRLDPPPAWFRTRIWPGRWYAVGYWAIPRYDSKFIVNDSCVGCKTCAKICPVGNVIMKEDRPTWQGRCEQCLACMQWCNKQAIDLGKKTVGVPRYRNPRVKRRQIIAQKIRPA